MKDKEIVTEVIDSNCERERERKLGRGWGLRIVDGWPVRGPSRGTQGTEAGFNVFDAFIFPSFLLSHFCTQDHHRFVLLDGFIVQKLRCHFVGVPSECYSAGLP